MNVNGYGSASSSRVCDDRAYNDSKNRPVGLATKIIGGKNTDIYMQKPNLASAPFVTPEDKRAGKNNLQLIDRTNRS